MACSITPSISCQHRGDGAVKLRNFETVEWLVIYIIFFWQ